ncbi:MAG: hypothetical protein KDC54_20025, partial [Lewinella sp.]|nr:hypothetical protein [Lewinella sp.]
TKSFRDEGHWQKVLDELQPGDYLFIQFGHNDAKDDTARFSSPDDYAINLGRYATEARAKGAHPVILTPVVRRRFDEQGQFYDTHGDYAPAARRAAAEYEVPLIDMQAKSEALLRELGEEESESLYLWLKPGEHPNYPEGVSDNTHFCTAGAIRMAGLAAEGIAEAKLPIRRYLLSR